MSGVEHARHNRYTAFGWRALEQMGSGTELPKGNWPTSLRQSSLKSHATRLLGTGLNRPDWQHGRLSLQIWSSFLTMPTGYCSLPAMMHDSQSHVRRRPLPSQHMVSGGHVVRSHPV